MGILQDLYDSEINFQIHISCFWDGGIVVKIGDSINGFTAEENCDTIHDAIEFLKKQVFIYCPDSDFVKNHI